MSNAPRPSTQRQHTRTSEKKRDAALDEGIKLTIDDVTYEVRSGDLTALDARALRQQVKMTFPELLEALGESPDIDLIAALVWLARRLKGERNLTYDEVAEDMGYDVFDSIDMAATGAEEVDEANPEA